MTEEITDRMVDLLMNPPDMQDDFTRLLLTKDYQFSGAKLLKDGTYVGLKRLAFTLSICIGVTRTDVFKRRYCFSDITQCIDEYVKITTGDDVPDGWIARRPPGPHDYDFRPEDFRK
jgi:hypothetical protein